MIRERTVINDTSAAPQRPPTDETIDNEAVRKQRERIFAYRLRKKLTERGWNQADLTRRLSQVRGRDVSRQAVSGYVRYGRHPSPKMMAALCEIFHCEPDDLWPSRITAPAAEIAAAAESEQEKPIRLPSASKGRDYEPEPQPTPRGDTAREVRVTTTDDGLTEIYIHQKVDFATAVKILQIVNDYNKQS